MYLLIVHSKKRRRHDCVFFTRMIISYSNIDLSLMEDQYSLLIKRQIEDIHLSMYSLSFCSVLNGKK